TGPSTPELLCATTPDVHASKSPIHQEARATAWFRLFLRPLSESGSEPCSRPCSTGGSVVCCDGRAASQQLFSHYLCVGPDRQCTIKPNHPQRECLRSVPQLLWCGHKLQFTNRSLPIPIGPRRRARYLSIQSLLPRRQSAALRTSLATAAGSRTTHPACAPYMVWRYRRSQRSNPSRREAT